MPWLQSLTYHDNNVFIIIKKAESTAWLNCLKMAQVCTYQLIREESGEGHAEFLWCSSWKRDCLKYPERNFVKNVSVAVRKMG